MSEETQARLLLVDDDQTYCSVLKSALEKRGFEVSVAYDVKSGLSLAEQFEPEYAVIDLRIGYESGLELVQKLISLDANTQIVMLTGFASIATAVEAIKLGAKHYLTKPANADEILQATLQHVVITFNTTTGRRIYINGNLIDVSDEEVSPLASWDDSFALILGKEASNQHTWQGDIRLLAIYNRVLSPEQIVQNYDVGVGEKFFLLFSVSELIDLANTYVMFEVSQFDSYSYLFNSAALVNIDGTAVTTAFDLKGLRIGVNGKESAQGQAYSNVDIAIASGQDLTEPFIMSPLGTIIGLEKGSNQDEFFLSFEQIGQHTNVKVPGIFTTPNEIPAVTESAQIGMRNFAEINHSMSALTGVNQETAKVFNTYQLVKRQLPSIENIETYISAQQMGITQLAIAYCDTAIENDALRNNWFPDVDFNQPPNIALSSNERTKLLTPLLTQLIPLNAATQPDKNLVYNELDSLIARLSVCDGICTQERTRTIAKASCTAVLASAVMLVQ